MLQSALSKFDSDCSDGGKDKDADKQVDERILQCAFICYLQKKESKAMGKFLNPLTCLRRVFKPWVVWISKFIFYVQ